MYNALFTPMNIGNIEIKNRLVMPAMNSHYGNEEHYFTQQGVKYYTQRARGGFGLLITEFLCVSEEGLATTTQAGIYNDKFIPMLKNLIDSVHENGAHIFAQLQHSGRMQGHGTTSLKAVGASAIPDKRNIIKVHELTTEEVEETITKFVNAAIRAKQAGFDGVEIHGAHGYLLAQFLSKGVNRRIDKYGGTASTRATIVCEIIKLIKKYCGTNFPIIVRSSGEEGYYGGNDIEDAIVQAKLFENSGADAIHISHGIPIHSYYTKAGFNIDNIRKVKAAVNIPVIGVGRINDATLALTVIETNSSDFVALGRQSICDPYFPNKVKEGRLEEIFTCTGCMQRCLYADSFEEGYGTSCMINPFSGKEGQWEITIAEIKKNIAIIGAGPAGLQAAWILQKRGHQVTVFEKENKPGGQYNIAAIPTMKQDLTRTISTYVTLCNKHGAKIVCNCNVNKEMLEKGQFDEIIVATGSSPIVPRIDGITNENVYFANDILTFKDIIINKKILVLGAGLVGVETAEMLAEYQNKVVIVDMISSLAPLAPFMPRLNLINHLEKLGVKSVLNSKVQKINIDGAEILKEDKIEILKGFECIVIAFGSSSNQELYNSLNEMKNLHLLGDANKVSDAKTAIFEASLLAMKL